MGWARRDGTSAPAPGTGATVPRSWPPRAHPAQSIEPAAPAVHRPNPFSRLVARITAAPEVADVDDAVPDEAHDELAFASDRGVTAPADAKATQNEVEATPPPELADVLSEVASLAAPLERPHTPVANGTYADPRSWMDDTPAEPTFEYRGAGGASIPAAEPDAATIEEDDTQFGLRDEAASPPAPGRHVRRLQSGRSDRREWNPTQPVTGRHVLPLGGPAVAAADRDRRLWLFGAVTVVLMLLGLLIGRQVTQTAPLAATHCRARRPTHHATTATPPTAAPLPVATPALSPIAIIPTAPTPQQLTGQPKRSATGASGFSVADVRYGEHPNDFRLVFDMAFPDTVTRRPDHGDRLRRADDALRRVHRRQRSVQHRDHAAAPGGRVGGGASRWCATRTGWSSRSR